MEIKTLKLKNFRNYSSLSLTPASGVNVFVGKNAQGKTNLLESIYFSCIGKSFKVCKDKEVILWGEENAKIELSVQKKFRNEKIEVMISKSQKKSILLDKLPIKKLSELIGEVKVVFFSPQELKLVRESPDHRRKFMDVHISQMNKRYFHALARYEKVLASRNKLFKITKSQDALKEMLDIYDRALVTCAKTIAFERKKFVEEILEYAASAHKFISGGGEELSMQYVCGCGVKLDEKFEENFSKALKKNFEKDCRLGYTSLGVHRDDIDIFLNGVEVKNFGSQGQQRTVALSLKLAELESMKDELGEYPILLLDDVFSELDAGRQRRLLKFVGRAQTFITCTDEKQIEGKIFEIENGKVKRVAEKVE